MARLIGNIQPEDDYTHALGPEPMEDPTQGDRGHHDHRDVDRDAVAGESEGDGRGEHDHRPHREQRGESLASPPEQLIDDRR